MKQISIITAAECPYEGAPGGWACVLRFGAVQKEFFGYAPQTSAERMELMAVIQGLLALKEACDVQVETTSATLVEGATRWMSVWKNRHWWKRYRPVRNADLWMELEELSRRHQLNWQLTADHERCRHLAAKAAEHQTSSWPDRRPHGELALNLGAGYIPPAPSTESLFGGFAGADDDESDPG